MRSQCGKSGRQRGSRFAVDNGSSGRIRNRRLPPATHLVPGDFERDSRLDARDPVASVVADAIAARDMPERHPGARLKETPAAAGPASDLILHSRPRPRRGRAHDPVLPRKRRTWRISTP